MGGTTERCRRTAQRLTICRECLLSPFVWSAGRRRRRWRERYVWAWVSSADVKLLFGHLSDRKPRRLPVSAKSVRGHRPRRGPQACNNRILLYFITEKPCLRVFGILGFFRVQVGGQASGLSV